MRTLLVSQVFPPQMGGSGRWFWEIYSRLPRDQVVVAAGEHVGAEAFDAGTDLPIFRVPLPQSAWELRSISGLKGYWRALRSVRRIVKREDISQLHCGACLPDGWVAYLVKQLYGIPYIQYMHGEELCYAGASRELGWMCRRVLNAADVIVANSRNTEQILREKWALSTDRIVVIHPGVDCDLFQPAPRNEEVRRKLGWSGRPVILTVGRLQRRKGHDSIIRAIPAIRERIPNILYAIAGDGEERTVLESLVQKLGLEDHVQFQGAIADRELISCYQQSDVFVLPNRQIGNDLEGFGMVLVEAQACGKPVVAGNTGGTVETMSIPETGIALDCDDLDKLVVTVTELLLDAERRREMGKAARKWVAGQFDWTVLTERARTVFFDQVPLAKESNLVETGH